MEALKYKYDSLKKSYQSLVDMISYQQKQDIILVDPVLHGLLNAGIIKHFEWTYEIAWKLLKRYLFEVHHQELNSPKAVFRACETYKVFPLHAVNELIILTDIRKNIPYIFEHVVAQEVYTCVIEHHRVFGIVLESMQKLLGQ
jgi:nucleotidyltransferase substrate binding protein (TIGR01987 family)